MERGRAACIKRVVCRPQRLDMLHPMGEQQGSWPRAPSNLTTNAAGAARALHAPTCQRHPCSPCLPHSRPGHAAPTYSLLSPQQSRSPRHRTLGGPGRPPLPASVEGCGRADDCLHRGAPFMRCHVARGHVCTVHEEARTRQRHGLANQPNSGAHPTMRRSVPPFTSGPEPVAHPPCACARRTTTRHPCGRCSTRPAPRPGSPGAA